MTAQRLSDHAEAIFAAPMTSAANRLPRSVAADPSPPASTSRGMEPRTGTVDAGGTTPRAGIELIVFGIPGPQGSKSFKGMRTVKATGKSIAVLVESSKKVKPWRTAVAAAVQELGLPTLEGPLAVQMVFTLPAPKRMPKGRVRPTCYPDLSKLLRSTEDALTGHAWGDDAQVVEYRDTAKYYPGQHPDALDEPGAVIRIWTIGGAG